MDNIGESFRRLRKDRGFTLQTMSEGIISFSYLSKFENGDSQITLANFIRLTTRLNMTIDEILYFNGTEMVNYSIFFQKILSAYNDNNVTTLKKYLKSEENLYKKTKINYYNYNRIMIAAIIKDLDSDFNIIENDIDTLVDYLLNCSFWTAYEISLFGNILPFFSEKLLIVLLKEVKKRINKYKVTSRNYRDLIGVIQNACIIFLRNQSVHQALALSTFLEPFLERIYYFEKTRKIYIDGIIDMAQGNIEKGEKKAIKAIKVMKLLDENYAKDHELELVNFKELY